MVEIVKVVPVLMVVTGKNDEGNKDIWLCSGARLVLGSWPVMSLADVSAAAATRTHSERKIILRIDMLRASCVEDKQQAWYL